MFRFQLRSNGLDTDDDVTVAVCVRFEAAENVRKQSLRRSCFVDIIMMRIIFMFGWKEVAILSSAPSLGICIRALTKNEKRGR